MRFPTQLALAAALALGALSVVAQDKPAAGDAARGKKMVSMCIGCHGIPAYRTAFPQVYSVPMIGGQSPGYIVAALKAYRSGERNHPSMVGIAKSLSDADMADLAAHYGAPK